MSLDVDPRNDYAFRCVFGNEKHLNILLHLLNAVMKLPPQKQITSIEILNPITIPVTLEDKQLILDIKAIDQTGRKFNVEMQMLPHVGLQGRLLFYWATLFSSQLAKGDHYDKLCPVISVCFLDGVLFKDEPGVHLHFQPRDEKGRVIFSDLQQFHLFQLPRFTKTLEELTDPLDKWLYFLNNGKEFDPDNLPPQFHQPEYQEAVTILKELTQEDIERERLEAREKARRDYATWQHYLQKAEAEVKQAQAEAQQTVAEAQAKAQQAVAEAQAEAQQAQVEAQQAQAEAQQAQAEVQQTIAQELIQLIQFCEEVLKREPTPLEKLQSMSVEDLRTLLANLRQEMSGASD